MSNDFLVFAGGGSANVVTQAQYAALGSLTNGFTSGTAFSNQLNKIFRQSSIMSAVMATLVNSITAQNVVDDGTTATILSNLMAAITRAGYVDDTGAVNAYVATLSPAILAYYDGMRIGFSTVNANTTTNPTLNVNGLGAITITEPGGGALFSGQLPANTVIELAYNSTGPRFELRNLRQNSVTPTTGDNSTRNATTAFVANSATRAINAQSGTTYTFVLADGSQAGNSPLATFGNASATTVTVPPNSSVAFPIGTQIDVSQVGAGKVTLAQGAGVTINSLSGNKSVGGQYGTAFLVKTATDTWLLSGSLTA